MTLPTRRGYSGVITFTDRGTKMMHAAPTRSLGENAEVTARHLHEQVVRYHGIPRQIVADRDKRLDNAFWSELSGLCGFRITRATA